MRKMLFIAGITLFLSSSLYAQETELIYLSGTSATDTKTWEFYCSAGMNSSKWTTIEVPSCWEQQGFGSYNYGHVPFEDRLNETGTYRYQFDVPGEWQGNEVEIVFEGVMTDASVTINGKSVGLTHQGAFYQFAYDVSGKVNYSGTNTLEVFVKKHSDNESVNFAERRADYWVFGGIFRPVYLQSKPLENIRRVAIDAKADGRFKADVFLSQLKNADNLKVEIYDNNGKKIHSWDTILSDNVTRVESRIANVLSWNPERPAIYKAVFHLKKEDKILHTQSEKFGFRTVEVRESDGIYVNGVRIKFKGVNRHTFHPEYARTSSKALSIEAVNLMKDMNMNAVRMSHYPPEQHFLEVCDSLGLFVLDELAGWQLPPYETPIAKKLVKEMIQRDVNHPSIILWDNGNENGWNYEIDPEFENLDIQKRELIHPREDFRQLNTLHYPKYNYLSQDGISRRQIFFPTEMLHGLYDGGHGAGLTDFWQRMWENPLSAGGFLWVFADEGVARTDRHGELDLDGNHAPDGILGPYLEKEGSYYTVKHIWSPVFFEKRYITPDFNGVFKIENRYLYTNLDQCKFKVFWLKYGSDEVEVHTLYKQEIQMPLEPLDWGELKVDLPKKWQVADVLKIEVKESSGHLINTWTWAVNSPANKTEELLSEVGSDDKPKLKKTKNEYVITVGKLNYSFDKQNGLLLKVTREGQHIPLTNGPVFVNYQKEVESTAVFTEEDGTIHLKTRFAKVDSRYENTCDYFEWIIGKNGLLQLKAAYAPESQQPSLGFGFNFPEEEIKAMKWMGRGPYRVWKNRMDGGQIGVWEKSYNNTMTGHSGFEYPEFKGYHAETYWAEVKTRNCPGFKIYMKTNDIFFKMLNPDQRKMVGIP